MEAAGGYALGDAVLHGALVVPPGVDEGRAVSDDTISRLLETRHARALSYYSRAAQKGSARGAFAAARVRSKGAPGVPRDRKLAHKLFDDALQADPERMRWPVFLARAQLRWSGRGLVLPALVSGRPLARARRSHRGAALGRCGGLGRGRFRRARRETSSMRGGAALAVHARSGVPRLACRC